jgi:hypothetical protein
MDVRSSTAEELMRMPGHTETHNDVDPWQRWDEELVEEFGRWISRLAKACAILLIVVSTGVLLRLF